MIEIIPTESITLVKHLGYQTYIPHYPHLWNDGGMEWYLHRCFNEQQLAADLADPALSYYAIRVEGQDAGLLKLVKDKTPDGFVLEKALYLEKIYFLKEFTGLGLGQQTMQWVCDQAVQWGFTCVWLMAMDTSTKAIASYERAGFQQIGNTHLDDQEFYRMKVEYRGMVVMRKEL